MVKVITILSIPSHVLWNQLLQAGLIHPLLSCCVLQSGPPVYFGKKYWTAAPITWPSGPCFTRWFWSRNDCWKGLGPENLWEPQSGCLVGRTAPQGRSPWSPITGSFFFISPADEAAILLWGWLWKHLPEQATDWPWGKVKLERSKCLLKLTWATWRWEAGCA